VFVMGWVSHLDEFWTEPSFARFLTELASMSRLIVFDKRGTGLSDRVTDLPTMEERMDDVRAVMDAAGSERAALMGVSEGGAMCALFAATFPERTDALIIVSGYGRRSWAPDYPWGITPDAHRAWLDEISSGWGGPVGLAARAPSAADDERFRTWWATYLRRSASPAAAVALTRMNELVDVRVVLPTIRVPTLVIHRSGDQAISVEAGRYLARQIRGAQLVELPGSDHLPFVGDQDAILDSVEEFLTGAPRLRHREGVLATVVAADIVGPEQVAARLGDARWGRELEAYAEHVTSEVERFRGRYHGRPGDPAIAAFDGPARAVRCALAIVHWARDRGLPARAAVHTGECDLAGGEIGGIAVHAAVALLREAAAGEVMASSTVRDLVPGSGITFEDRGAHPLAGVVPQWRLLRVVPDAAVLATAPAAAPAPARGSRAAMREAARLTAREREVAALVARGLSNRQIADALVISPGTADRHVANILTKLGYRSRAQIAALAAEEGLTARD
jgi:pimeloyl-ACP methyl ester carboxylesterase/DNA-binding NarL/FixJ family response regulator